MITPILSLIACFLIATGTPSPAFSAEDGPVPATAPAPAGRISVIPLGRFGIQPGQQVTIGGRQLTADAGGLPLPVDVPVEVVWQGQGGEARCTITCIDAASPPAATWALADPVVNPDGSIIAVGSSYGPSVQWARERAKFNAVKQAQLATAPTTTTVTDANDGRMTMHSVETRTQATGSLSFQIQDCVLTICADPASIPAAPRKPGAPVRMSDQTRPDDLRPWGCWVRIVAKPEAAKPPTAAEERARAATRIGAAQAFRDLDALIDKELHGATAPAPTP